MNNLISTCYVIEKIDGMVEPVIFLKMPHWEPGLKINMFHDPFSAKAFIRMFSESVEIIVDGGENVIAYPSISLVK